MRETRSAGLEALSVRAADGLVAIRLDGRIVQWNDAATALLGHPRIDVVGRRCWDVLAGSDGSGERVCRENCPVIQRERAGQAVPSFDLRVRTNTGRLLLLDVSTLSARLGNTPEALVIHLVREIPGPPGRAGDTAAPTDAGPDPREHGLTRRELEVLSLTREGLSTRLIAERLRVSTPTVRNHTQSILRKLGVHSRLEAAAWATRRRPLP